jgi:hypothetical protein
MAIVSTSPNSNGVSKRASADQSITSSTTFADATGLTANLDPNKSYRFELNIVFNLVSIVSGYKFQLVGPASPPNVISVSKVFNGVLGTLLSATTQTSLSSSIAGALATAGLHVFTLEGLIENGANAGTLKLQFAQNTSDANAITLKRGSYLLLYES